MFTVKFRHIDTQLLPYMKCILYYHTNMLKNNIKYV